MEGLQKWHVWSSTTHQALRLMARERKTKSLKDSTPIIIGAGITEQFYFKHLNNLGYFKCKVKPRFNLRGRENAHELAKKIELALEETLGKVICVFDYDVLSQNEEQASKLEELFNEYSDRVKRCDNMPCFEYWLLLHFEKNHGSFASCASIVQLLQKHLPNYQKAETFLEKDSWVKTLEPLRPTAIQRASQCQARDSGAWTNVYKAFQQA